MPAAAIPAAVVTLVRTAYLNYRDAEGERAQELSWMHYDGICRALVAEGRINSVSRAQRVIARAVDSCGTPPDSVNSFKAITAGDGQPSLVQVNPYYQWLRDVDAAIVRELT